MPGFDIRTIPKLPLVRSFADTFNRANGALSGWDFTNSAWTISGNVAICTPTLGAELFANGAFGADTNWTKGTGWAIASGTGNHTGATASNITQAVGAQLSWYRLAADVTATNATSIQFHHGGQATNGLSAPITTIGSYICARQQQAASLTLGIRAGANEICSVDNASAKLITASDVFASKEFSLTNATISAIFTIGSRSLAGVVGWLDSYTSPASYITAYHHGTRFFLDKVVAGTVTNLLTVTNTNTTGRISITGVRSGASLLIDSSINGTVVGTRQTVTDAQIISNTRHGMFSTDASNSIDSFSITL